MSKRFMIVILICVLGLVGVYIATSKKDSNSASGSSSAQLTNHVMGDNAKKVTLVEYGDFQCPYCGQYYPIIKQVVEKYKSDIQFQFRNFPLDQHQNARAAARAAEAAGKQGKYWEMHDLLYEQQSDWENSTSAATVFEGYASQLGLNLNQFKTDFASSEVNDAINADRNEGTRLGVDATPTFFLQGKKLADPPTTADAFGKLLDDTIKNTK
jgi:protein-disulfide isomerase